MTVETIARKQRQRSGPPPPADPVTGYALDVTAGRIIAGELVHKAAERHLRDLADGGARGLHFDVKAAQRAIDFFPLMRHYKGEWGPRAGHPHGDPIHLAPWQQFLVGSLFGWKRADGTRRFRSVYCEVAKKNGKTLLAAGLGILLAFFDGEAGAEVYAGATKRDQAKLVWTDAAQMVKKSPGLLARIRVLAGSLAQDSSASFFQPLGQDSDTDQGINVHGAIIDELHVHKNRDLLTNLETATSARRQPVVVKITTAGVKRESVWSEERADAAAVVEGRATDDAMLVLIYTIDKDDDPFDEAVWPKANPNLGISVNIETLRDQAAKAKRSPGALGGFLRFRMNVATSASTAAISIDEWNACTGLAQLEDGSYESFEEWAERTFNPRDEAGRRVTRGGYAGLDLASIQDLTALILLFRDDQGVYDVLCRFWCPEEGVAERTRRDGVPYSDWVEQGWMIATPGNVTDYAFVKAEVLSLAEQFVIGEVGFDRWNATQIAVELEQEGATMVPVSQTHAGLAPGFRELQKVILERAIRHGGHPILRWMAGNVESELDPAGNEKPSKRASAERIDGIVALTMAMGRWLANGDAPNVWSAA